MRQLLFEILLIFSILLNTLTKGNEIISVQTSSGKINGKVVRENDKDFNVFLGIPYAKPPLLSLRFQPPQPLDSSAEKHTVDASVGFSKKCMQPLYSEEDSEDCLYLNVMTPKHNDLGQPKYPVMVWIHGGGFSYGSASDYPVQGTLKNIVSRDVIFVSINYRLGVFGFFTTKSPIAAGNYGMLDQVEALRWVQKNIQAFGGDPLKVTIFGESTGGSSASLLTISPLSQGLFNQAILMSGSALGSYSTMPDESPVSFSEDLLNSLNCTSKVRVKTEETCTKDDCPHELSLGPQCPYGGTSRKIPAAAKMFDLDEDKRELECLQSKSNQDIFTQNKFLFGWSIRVDDHFLHNTPEESMKSRPPYNLMIGVTRDEAASFSLLEYAGIKPVLVLSEESFYNDTAFTNFYPLCKHFKYPELVNFTSRYHYARRDLGQRAANLNEREVWFQKYSEVQSGPMFWIPAYREAMEALKTKSKVYLYSWDWQDATEFYRSDFEFYYKGAVHASELAYLFDMSEADILAFVDLSLIDKKYSKKDKRFDTKAKNLMGTLWTNFAKFGNPTPDTSAAGTIWELYNEKEKNYLSINLPDSKMKNDFYSEDVEFWNNFLPNLENSFQCQ